MRELKASTKAGQNIIAKAGVYDGYWLHQIYDRWSTAKVRAYNWCYDQFLQTENNEAFSISWLGTKNGENILRFETKDNSYLVWLDR